MDRRKLLAAVLVALLAATAGCSSSGTITMSPVDNASLATEASTDVSTLEPHPEATLVRDAIENGSTTTVDRQPPIQEPLPYRYEGAFYNLSYTETGTQPGYVGEILIDYNASSVDGEVVDYGDLPAVDQNALRSQLVRSETPEVGLEPGYDFGTVVTYTESEANASVLATGQEYDAVRYEGEAYPVGVGLSSETLTTYRYESTLVAESAAAYGTTLRDNYGFELSGLSDAERSVLENALNDTNYIEDNDNNGFDSLVDRFRSHESVVGDDDSGQYVAQYDGQVYWVEVEYGNYLDDESN